MKDTPYRDCEKRTMACHDDCEEYLAFRAEREASRKKQWHTSPWRITSETK